MVAKTMTLAAAAARFAAPRVVAYLRQEVAFGAPRLAKYITIASMLCS